MVRGDLTPLPAWLSGDILLPALCVAGLFAVHGYHAAEVWFWSDEIMSVEAAQMTWRDLVVNRYNAAHSPLYFAFLKIWIYVAAGFESSAPPSEFVIRLPSLVLMGLAGGILAVVVRKSWGIWAALLVVAVWVLHYRIGYHATEARPYPLLMFFLAITIWANQRLILEFHQGSGETRWVRYASFAAPALAVATIPLGFIAAGLIEVGTFWYVWSSGSEPLKQRWRRRIKWVWPIMLGIFATFLPIIVVKSDNYWLERANPLSWDGTIRIVRDLAGTDEMAMFGLLLALVLFGAFMRRKDFMTTMGISLAIVFPLLMIGLSAVSSLMSPRYFLPMAVGVLILLSAGLTATQNRWVMVTLSAFVIWFFANSIGVRHDEDYRYRIVAQVRFLESLGPGPFTVNVRGPALAREFRYNISKKTAIKANVKTVHGFEDIGEIPKGGVLWYQPNFIKRDVTVLLKRIPVVCEINVAKRAIYALARDRAHLPEAIRDCENLSK